MSKLEELLKNEKVEWKKLGEVAELSGAGVDKKIIEGEKKIKLLNYMDVYKHQYLDANVPTMIVTASDLKIKNCNIELGDIFLTPSSETTEDIFKTSVSRENMNGVVYSYHIMRIRLRNKNYTTSCFLNYYFSSEIFRKTMFKVVYGNTRKTIAKSEIEKLEIPIPSLETQEKIVKILDKFTNYVTELQAELQLRTKQYNYYRDMLLSEEYLEEFSEKLNLTEVMTESSLREKQANYYRDKIFEGLENQANKSRELRYTTLGEVGTFTRGNGLQKKDFKEQGKPVIHYGQIYTKFGFSTDKTISFVDDALFKKLKKAKMNDLIITDTSENIKDVFKPLIWEGKEEVGISGHSYVYSTTENSRYIGYYLQSNEFYKQKIKKAVGTKVISITKDDMEKFKIILPPLPLQSKIVEILDKFQALVEDTKGLLPEEIEQRQKQYEYYREKLLTFDIECANTHTYLITDKYFVVLKQAAAIVGVKLGNVRIMTLGEVAKENLSYGSGASAVDYDGQIRYIRITDIMDNGILKQEKVSPSQEEDKYLLNYGDILFARSGATVGKNYFHTDEEKSIYAGYLIKLSVDENIALPKYIFYSVNTTDYSRFVQNIKSSGSQPNINAKQYSNYKICVPPLPVQQHVVDILDKFETLVNDVKEGLPHEIELRQKEYEYYREQLLTFDKKQ